MRDCTRALSQEEAEKRIRALDNSSPANSLDHKTASSLSDVQRMAIELSATHEDDVAEVSIHHGDEEEAGDFFWANIESSAPLPPPKEPTPPPPLEDKRVEVTTHHCFTSQADDVTEVSIYHGDAEEAGDFYCADVSESSAPNPPPKEPTPPPPLEGKRVVISGLVKRTDLNGARGVVERYVAASGRYRVRLLEGESLEGELEQGSSFNLKAVNLTLDEASSSAMEPRPAGWYEVFTDFSKVGSRFAPLAAASSSAGGASSGAPPSADADADGGVSVRLSLVPLRAERGVVPSRPISAALCVTRSKRKGKMAVTPGATDESAPPERKAGEEDEKEKAMMKDLHHSIDWRLDAAFDCKDRGNAAIKQGSKAGGSATHYRTALAHYTDGLAVLLEPVRPGQIVDDVALASEDFDQCVRVLRRDLHNNCAQACLLMKEWSEAASFASLALRDGQGNVKALCRRALARIEIGGTKVETKELALAVHDLEGVLKRFPEHEEALALMRRAAPAPYEALYAHTCESETRYI